MKNRSINVRVDEDTYNYITELSLRYGISRAEVVRLFLEDKIDVSIMKYSHSDFLEKLKIEKNLINLLGKLESNFMRIGININQATKKINQNSKDTKLLSVLDDINNNILKANDVLNKIVRGDKNGNH